MKRPLIEAELVAGDQPRMIVQSRLHTALVVSQCCRNVGNDYVAVVPIQPLGGLSEDQERALVMEEPPPPPEPGERWDYAIEHFRLHPLPDALEERPGRYQVAQLNRVATFWGDCSDLLPHRRARMTPAARRLLRINLALFWSRVEETDVEALRELGLEPGF